MIKYSHVALNIPLQDASGDYVSKHLGVTPTRIQVANGHKRNENDEMEPYTRHTWMLDSELDGNHPPIARIHSLIERIEHFSERLLSLDEKYERWIDVLFHVTPHHPHGVQGEFDWIIFPYETMGRLSALKLMISYESIWFDHPEWKLPWYKRLFR